MWKYADLYPVLSQINSPDDLKRLPKDKLEPLAAEIRSYLVNQVTENGGHLASNLGVVELTIAIHRVFSTPTDHVIFDVGHQTYVHKLLTGRKEVFSTLRQGGGISGFPKRSESIHDCFGTGHASTSFSAALGFAEADRISGSPATTVCVFGDGAYTGGMIHEALNNCRKDLRLVIILNENEMSISKNIGRFATQLSKIRSSKGYWRTKSILLKILSGIPFIGKKIVFKLRRYKRDVKGALYGSNIFENLGLQYLGPIDGNNEEVVEKMLLEAKDKKQSCILHIKTKKGKGYLPAEKSPDCYHGMAPKYQECFETNFSKVMGEKLSNLAEKNQKICAITAAMTSGTGLTAFSNAHPKRFFDVGIAEEHAVTFAAGLAANGYRPAVAIYSTFLQRAYDNILHDVALQNLPVVFLIDRAGINASDGPTHSGVFDVSFLSQIPNMRIYTPITFTSLENAMNAAFRGKCPCAIRYPNGTEDREVVDLFYGEKRPVGIAVRSDFSCVESEPAVLIVTHGRIVNEAIKAKKSLFDKHIQVGILLLEQIAPYHEIAKQVSTYFPKAPFTLLFLEEEVRSGGMGQNLAVALSDEIASHDINVINMALDDPFQSPKYGETTYETAGLDSKSIENKIRRALTDQKVNGGRQPCMNITAKE